MSASSRGGRASLAMFRASPRICSQCAVSTTPRPLLAAQQRLYSAAAAAAAVPETPAEVTTSSNTDPASATRALYKIKSGVILTRAPLLTRPLTPFESSFYLYQKRLNERLTAPFRKPLYFKPDTAPELDWRIKVREREGTPARDIGVYHGRGRDAWNDEVVVGNAVSDPAAVQQALLRDAESRVSEDGEELPEADRVRVEAPAPRTTEADKTGDVRRLDRQLDRTLYLVVRGPDGKWGFPSASMMTDENLHEAAARVLESAAGVNMNTWLVGRVPVAHLVNHPVIKDDAAKSVEKRGEKVFFLKGRIMAGQADLEDNTLGLTDFKWLTKEELKETLTPHYYQSVRNMMAER